MLGAFLTGGAKVTYVKTNKNLKKQLNDYKRLRLTGTLPSPPEEATMPPFKFSAKRPSICMAPKNG